MNRFADLLLRSRITLIVVVSCMSAIAVASGTSVVANNLRGRAEFAQRIQTLAFMTADNNRAALAFGNVAAAKRILETFRAEPSVDSVALYEMDGSVYASFVRDGLQSPDLSQALAIDGHRFSATGLEVRQTLALLDQDLGILQIHSNLDALNSRLLADALVSLALGAMGCLFATGVAWRLQRSVSELRLRRQDGSWINVEMNAKTLDDGRIQAILRDLSERSRLEERLLQGQKMEAIRRLAGAGSPTTSTISSQ